MATSREVDSIGTIIAGAPLSRYSFVALTATGWMPASAALATAGSLIGVSQQDVVLGEAVNVMIKGQSKFIFTAPILSAAAASAGILGAPVTASAVTAGAGAVGTADNKIGWITEPVLAAGNIGSIFLES
jgi:hypothetical protein